MDDVDWDPETVAYAHTRGLYQPSGISEFVFFEQLASLSSQKLLMKLPSISKAVCHVA